MVYQIGCSDFPIDKSPAFPNRRVARRPYLKITLANGSRRFSCYAIVDSGADHCTFPLSFALQLGLDPLTGITEGVSGLGSSNVPTYFWNIAIDVQSVFSVKSYAGFTQGLEQWGIGLLGQSGFFDQVNVAFNHNSGIFTMEPNHTSYPPISPSVTP